MLVPKVNVVILGSGGVGKSAITISFINNQFMEEYDPTIEDSYTKNFQVDGKEYQLDITDTAGQEEYRGLWGDKFLRSGDGFVLVYTITLKSSFDELKTIRDQVLRARDGEDCPMVFVGNKCDLNDLREVDASMAREYVEQNRGVFIESSAKEKINIEAIFANLVREILKMRGSAAQATNINEKANKKSGGCCIVL